METAIFIVKNETIQPDIKGWMKRNSARDIASFFSSNIWISFVNQKGEKVLIVHGSEYGIWPTLSSIGLERNPDADVIYCCYPKIMRRHTGESRIQWNEHAPVYLSGKINESGKSVITVELRD